MMPFLIMPLCMFSGDTGPLIDLPDGRIVPDGIEGLIRCADGTVITMKSGVVYCTTLTVEQIEQHLKSYWQQMAEMARKAQGQNIFKIN